MSKVALDSIQALTFYNDALTTSRRGPALPQLVCVGKACNLFTPDVVRCLNVGGRGSEVDWKCETDLPERLRLGRVQVSCEGWSGPGDLNILKGSCSLEYRLLEISKNLSGDGRTGPRIGSWFTVDNFLTVAFYAIFICVLYIILKPCLSSYFSLGSWTSRRPGPPPPSGHGWMPFNSRPHDNPPPPYSKYSTNSSPSDPVTRDGPGFWTGMALGGLGTYMLNNRTRRGQPSQYDWERERFVGNRPSYSTPQPSGVRPSRSSYEDQGEGSSNLGSIRRSTGYGGSNVR